MAPHEWRRVGIWQGGTVHSLALSPSFTQDKLILAGTGAGVFRSTDAGRTWARAMGLSDPAVQVVAFAPHTPRLALATTRGGSMFVSSDCGANWQRVPSWAYGLITTLVFSPDFENDRTLFAATNGGLFRSLDGGNHWQSTSFGLLDDEILCLVCAADFARSEVVWAGSAGGGVYRSRNAGRAWRESGHGLADSAVQCLAIGESALFAGTEDAGVFRLTDQLSWAPCGLAGQGVNSLVASGSTVIAGTTEGIVVSHDNGNTWRRASGEGEWANVLSLATANGVAVAGLLGEGILLSNDGGQSWHRSNDGLAAHAPPLAAQSPDGAMFLLDTSSGIVHSTDGSSWRDTHDALDIVDSEITAALDAHGIQTLATGGNVQSPIALAATERHIWRWDGTIRAWVRLIQQPPLHDQEAVNALAVTRGGVTLVGTRRGDVHVSLDRDGPWHTLAPLPNGDVVTAMHLSPSGSLFVLSISAKSESSFSATAWQMPTASEQQSNEAAAPVGGEWRMIAALDSLRVPLACLAVASTEHGERLYLGGQSRVAIVTLSADTAAGAAPDARITALEPDVAVTALAIVDRYMIAATSAGVFTLNEEQDAWQTLGKALTGVPIVALLASADRKVVHAVALGGEVWRLEA